MTRPEGDLPPELEYSDFDLTHYRQDAKFQAQVYAVAQLAQFVYRVSSDEGTAFGIQVVNAIDHLATQTPLD